MKVQLNSDTILAEEATKQVLENGGYCPCMIERSERTKCMCEDFRNQIKQGIVGECYCGRYEVIE